MPPAALFALMLGVLLAINGSLRASGDPEFTYHRGWLHLNGYTHHFEVHDANAKLLGGGFTWYSTKSGIVIASWTADVYQDSARKLSGLWVVPGRCRCAGAASVPRPPRCTTGISKPTTPWA